jgi:hypothetical protein
VFFPNWGSAEDWILSIGLVLVVPAVICLVFAMLAEEDSDRRWNFGFYTVIFFVFAFVLGLFATSMEHGRNGRLYYASIKHDLTVQGWKVDEIDTDEDRVVVEDCGRIYRYRYIDFRGHSRVFLPDGTIAKHPRCTDLR